MIRIVEVTLNDIPFVSKFLSVHAPKVHDEKGWEDCLSWMWSSNPNVSNSHLKLGWCIKDDFGSIKAFIGSIPVTYYHCGKEVSALWGTSWYVDEEVRDYGLKMYFKFTSQKLIILSNTQSEAVEIIMKKLRFNLFNSFWFETVYLVPLNYGLFNNLKKLYFKNLSFNILLFLIGSFFLGVLSFFLRKIPKGNNISISVIEEFPYDTDEWFKVFQKATNFTLKRDLKVMSWLFCNSLSKNDFLKISIYEQNILLGFVIFKKKKLNTFLYLELIDEVILPGKSHLLSTIYKKIKQELLITEPKCLFLILRRYSNFNPLWNKDFFGISIKKFMLKSYIKGLDISESDCIISTLDGDYVFF